MTAEANGQTTSVATMTLDDEMPWHPLFGGRDDVYDDIGFTIVAEAGEYDVLVGNFIYRFQGGKPHPKSRWLANGIVNNNLVMISHRDKRGTGMYDNNFSRNGMNLNDFYDYDDLQVIRTDESVTYRLGRMEYVCRPPEWTMKGTTGEVEYDVTFHQTDESVVWPFGTRADAANKGLGGGYCYVEATGTITVAGTIYPIKNGHGVHERLAYSQHLNTFEQTSHDPEGLGVGFALHMTHPEVGVWGLGQKTNPMFFLTVAGKQLTYLANEPGKTVAYEPVETWHDPRSGMTLPSRWRLHLESTDGTFELDVRAMARAYYPFEMKCGSQMMYWHLAVATGSFTYPDGSTIAIGETLVQHEIVKIIMSHTETMAGPAYTPEWDR